MPRFLLIYGLICIFSNIGLAQTILFNQDFEGSPSDNWNYTLSPPAYNVSGDVWDTVMSDGNISNPFSGSYFMAMRDLDNPNGGGDFYHQIDFDAVDLSNDSNVYLRFYYYTDGWETGSFADTLRYVLEFDTLSSWADSGTVLLTNTQQWKDVIISIPDSTTYIRLRIEAKQNGGSDYGGVDKIELITGVGDFFPPIVQSVVFQNSQTLVVVFNEVMDSTAIDTSFYDMNNMISSIQFGNTMDTVYINLTNNLLPGDVDTLNITAVQDSSGNPLSSTFTYPFLFNRTFPDLMITEIMYNDPSGPDSLEFLEIYNNGSDTAFLVGFYMVGVSYNFPNHLLAPGDYYLIAGDSVKCQNYFGVPFYDWGTGGLVNTGELLEIRNAQGDLIDSVDYDDISPWPVEGDGNGPSIELSDINLDNSLGVNWTASISFVDSFFVDSATGYVSVFASPGNTQCLIYDTTFTSICPSDSASLFGVYQNMVGFYSDTVTTGSCDSIHVIQLTHYMTYQDTIITGICSGDSILIAGIYRTISGIYYDSLSTILGCDSVTVFDLSVDSVITFNTSLSICANDSVYLEGSFQNSSGNYTDSLTSAGGCDSLVFTTLQVFSPSTISWSHQISGAMVQFSSNVSGTGSLNYNWDFGDGNSDNTSNPFHVYSSTGVYQVCLVITDSCTFDSICQNVTVITLSSIPNIVITEIMYNPPEAGSDSLEFIEIYNNDIISFNLSGYTLGGVNFTFPSVLINPGDFIVTCVDSVAVANTLGVNGYEWNSGSLSNSGEAISIYDNSGSLIDTVFYDDVSPWPTGSDGGGYSLVLCDPLTDNLDAANWIDAFTPMGVLVNGLQVFANPGFECPNSDSIPPVITDWEMTTDSTIFIIFNEDMDSLNSSGGFIVYLSDTITPFLINGDTIWFYLNSQISNGSFETITVEGFDDAAGNTLNNSSITVVFNNLTPDLVITEIMYNDPTGADDYEFIEIYNNDTVIVAMGGLYLGGVDFTFPEISIAPGDFILVAKDSALSGGFYNQSFYQWAGFNGLTNAGEAVYLRNTQGGLIDTLFYLPSSPWPIGAVGTGYSMHLISLNADNSIGGNWWANESAVNNIGPDTVYASPGSANFLSEPLVYFNLNSSSTIEGAGMIGIEVNILMPDSGSVVDVVIQNGNTATNADFQISNPQITFPNGSSASQTITINIADDFIAEPIEKFSISLNPVSNCQLGSPAIHEVTITDNETITDILINEIMTNNASTVQDENGEFEPWIELYNASAYTVDLSQSVLIYNSSSFRLGSDTLLLINPGSHKLLWADGDSLASSIHLGFTMNLSAGYLRLDRFDNFMLDTVSFPTMNVYETYSRNGDGAPNWYLASPTPESENPFLDYVSEINSSAPNIYPNPVSNTVYLGGEFSGDLFSITGKKIDHFTNVSFVDVTDLPNGMYYLQFIDQNSPKQVVKFIIRK